MTATGPAYPPSPTPPPLGPPPAASFIGSISGTTLTVTTIVSGTILPGQLLDDDIGSIVPGTSIVAWGPNTTGKLGTYVVSPSYAVPVASEAMRTQPLFDIWATIMSQYANSPVITQILQNLQAYLDPTANLNAFYRNMWNILTASGYGLDVWGRIVGVIRTLNVPTGVNLGFSGPLGSSGDSFNVAPFYGGAPLTSNFTLDDTTFRRLILAKAASNITNGSIPAINQLLLNLFPGRGNCYVTDNRNMTLTYTFQFLLTPVEQAIVSQSGVLPKSTGVLATVAVAGLPPLGRPFSNGDWPNPRGYAHPTSLRSFLRQGGTPGGTLPIGSGTV